MYIIKRFVLSHMWNMRGTNALPALPDQHTSMAERQTAGGGSYVSATFAGDINTMYVS